MVRQRHSAVSGIRFLNDVSKTWDELSLSVKPQLRIKITKAHTAVTAITIMATIAKYK
jgi:hypothetical protein